MAGNGWRGACLALAALAALGLMPAASRAEAPGTKEIETLEPVGYYARVLEASLDPDDLFLVSDRDGTADLLDTDIAVVDSMVAASLRVDSMVADELDSGAWTWDNPLVITDPYQNAPLTGLILFCTEQPCRVRVTVKGKTAAADFTGVLPEASAHRVPVIGLYPGEDTPVLLELLDADGNAVQSRQIDMHAEKLPKALRHMVDPVQCSGASACGLVIVYGQKCANPFGIDCNGDIRWYLKRKVGNYGLYTLSDGHLIAQDTMGYTYNLEKPQSTNLYELDLLGRYWRMYYLANGSHHEVIEKTPGGNLLCLTSTMEEHYEDEIVELDRQTGAVVNELELIDIFGDIRDDLLDWAHINTVSWREEDDTILISCRNLHSVMKIGWTDHALRWILSDPEFWRDTPFSDAVLKPEGHFHWQYQQHSAYWLEADLDGNPDTREISLFDNHTENYRPIDSYDDLEDSYVKVFAIDEAKGTAALLWEMPVIRSMITSNAHYDPASGHMFAMCGYLPKELLDGWRGMLYEFDYASGDLLNRFAIAKTFYRASPVWPDFTGLAQAMAVEENYIKGTLKQAVEVDEAVEIPNRGLPEGETVSLKLVGRTLYVSAPDHTISQVIFRGNDHTYVYDAATVRQFYEKYADVDVPMPIPIQPLAADDYRLLCVYKDALCDLGAHIATGE